MNNINRVCIESPALPSDRVEIQSLSGREAISQLFAFELAVIVRGSTELDERKLLTSPAALVFESNGVEVTRMFGMIAGVRDSLQDGSSATPYLTYTLTFVPRAWRMTLAETSEVFLDQSVVDIISDKLTRAGLALGKDFELRLRSKYPVQEFVVQYGETDLAFVSRLTEHAGIAFFFEHRDAKDVLVFTDHNNGFGLVPGGLVPFSQRGERLGIFALDKTTRPLPHRYVVKDYNYRTPQISLMATAPMSGVGGDVVEYGAHFKTPDEANQMAKIRAEEMLARETVFGGKSDVHALRAGSRLELHGHNRADGEYLLVEVRHVARQVTLAMGTGDEVDYTNEFAAILAKTPFRPARVTPKPKVHGVIHGVIEGAAKSKYAEVDNEGRYRVRFQFDTSDAQHGKASRPIRMSQPHVGPGYGIHFPLRDGVEVLLTCIDGDPDRPIISGAVPNPTTPSTVADKNGRRNVIRTGGGNEINLDDAEGSSRIKMTVPFGNTIFQLGAPNLPHKGAVLTTDENVRISAGGNIVCEADVDVEITADADAHIKADGNMTLKAGPLLSEEATEIKIAARAHLEATAPVVDVKGGGNVNVKAPWVDIEGGAKIRAGAPLVEVNSGNTNISAASRVQITAGANADTNATYIGLNAGAKVRVSAPVVEVNAPTVLINGGTSISIKGGTVKIDGSTVTIKGGTINLNS